MGSSPTPTTRFLHYSHEVDSSICAPVNTSHESDAALCNPPGMMKLAVAKEYLEAEAFEWETMYGTDTLCPPGHKYEGYPYWVEYMPNAIREVYISEVSPDEFVSDQD